MGGYWEGGILIFPKFDYAEPPRGVVRLRWPAGGWTAGEGRLGGLPETPAERQNPGPARDQAVKPSPMQAGLGQKASEGAER